MEPECIKSNKPCPTFCQGDEIECEFESHLIRIPDNGDENCPTLCPANCESDEIACDGSPPIGATTCQGEPLCIPKYDESTGK